MMDALYAGMGGTAYIQRIIKKSLIWIRILLEKNFSNYCLCFCQNQKRGTDVGVNAVQAPVPGCAGSFCIDTPK